MKIKNYLPLIGLLLLISFNVLGETTVPLKLNVSAVLRYSDGTEINTVTSENVKIGLYSTSTDYVWRKTFSLMITNGLIEATLNGEGTNSAGNSLQLTETLFETEGLKVGFTIVEDGQEKLALVELTSQPYSIKSAIADYANTAGDTTKIQGKAVSSTAPTANQILAYVNDQWVPSNLNNNMINIDNYAFPVNDETEVSGTISNVKVEKLLGKKLTSSVINGQDIPTGAVLMFSPDVDAPNGAFHPSSGDPIDGEVLTWDSVTNVWMPSTNSLVKLDDVVPPTNLTPVKNIMVYDTTLQKYKVTDLAISYFTDIDTDGANDSDILKYNATSGNWEDGTILTSDLSEGVVGSYAILDGTIKEIDLSTEYLDSEQAKETAIRADFATADAALQADIDLNESDSDAADAALQADIDLNESDSDTADAALQADIDLNESDSDTADAALQADIDQNEIDSDTADAALQADIDLNESDSDTADAALQADIDQNELDSDSENAAIRSEIATANAALQADIDLNESDSDTADAALQADIDLNESDSDTADAALQADIDLNESDSDSENAAIRSEFATADAALQADIDQNEIDSDSENAAIRSEIATANAALQADIDLNESDSDTADAALQADIDQNEIDSDAADAALQASINQIVVGDMNDVNISGVITGNILKYDGSNWVNNTLLIEEMTNVDTTGVLNGQVLKYNGSDWVDANLAVSEMSDVDTTNAAAGNVLKYDGSAWIDSTLSISDLTNVNLTGAALGSVLTYNNGNWEVGNPILGTTRATSMFVGAENETPTTNTEVKLHVGGDAQIDGAIYISGGSDLAEGFHIIADNKVEPGTVVSIDPNNIGKLIVSYESNDTKVAGVVSGANGINAGLIMTQTGTLADGEYPIALTGRVWVKCTNENGEIQIGDLLTTSSQEGHAMRSGDAIIPGSVLGKAMSTCTDNGMVLTLISLQ